MKTGKVKGEMSKGIANRDDGWNTW